MATIKKSLLYKLREGTHEQALIQAEKEIQQGVARQYAGNLGLEP